MNGRDERICDSIEESLEKALSADDLPECKYHSREALQLLVGMKDEPD